MNKLPENSIYSMDLITIKDHIEFKEEVVLRLRYKWYGETYTMLFQYDSDLREYVDEHHQSWMRNYHRNQPPDPQADPKA